MTQTLLRPLLLAALLLGATSPGVLAQVAPLPSAPSAPNGEAPGAGSASDPCVAAPGQASGGQSLTGQLSKCGGVLVPPPTGTSGIEAPVPDPDPRTTPVLPPSGLPDAPNGADAT